MKRERKREKLKNQRTNEETKINNIEMRERLQFIHTKKCI